LPLVIQAEPFGSTELTVFDTDFLQAPEGPLPADPEVPGVPEWVALAPVAEPLQLMLPILLLEFPS
jgi:hypothetical protein